VAQVVAIERSAILVAEHPIWHLRPALPERFSRLVSRRGLDHTARFAALAKFLAALPSAELILDGEVAVFDERLVFAVPRLAGSGHEAWAEVQELGLEGFVGKDPTSTYRSGGRTRQWLKSKVRQEGEFVVGGVVEAPLLGWFTARRSVGSTTQRTPPRYGPPASRWT
jgi:hypothetical protein